MVVEADTKFAGARSDSGPIAAGRRVGKDQRIAQADRVNACVLLGRVHAGDSISSLQRLCRPGIDSTVRLAALRSLVRITGKTRGYRPAQSARDRERAFRAWATAES